MISKRPFSVSIIPAQAEIHSPLGICWASFYKVHQSREGNIQISIILWRGVFIRQIGDMRVNLKFIPESDATDTLCKKMLSASHAGSFYGSPVII